MIIKGGKKEEEERDLLKLYEWVERRRCSFLDDDADGKGLK